MGRPSLPSESPDCSPCERDPKHSRNKGEHCTKRELETQRHDEAFLRRQARAYVLHGGPTCLSLLLYSGGRNRELLSNVVGDKPTAEQNVMP